MVVSTLIKQKKGFRKRAHSIKKSMRSKLRQSIWRKGFKKETRKEASTRQAKARDEGWDDAF